MSLATLLSPTISLTPDLRASPTPTFPTSDGARPIPFQHQPIYVSLSRKLTRYTHILLLHPPPDVATPNQRQIQNDLRSPLPYHRTKWLHNIEYCRTLLLQLEHASQAIKVQSVKRNVVHDLAEKRATVKKLRRYIEEVGREVEEAAREGRNLQEGEEVGETVADILTRSMRQTKVPDEPYRRPSEDDVLQEGKPVSSITADPESSSQTTSDPLTSSTAQKDELFRRRRHHPKDTVTDTATTSGFTSLPTTEKTLLSSSREHESLSLSLLNLATQLKQGSQNLQHKLSTEDKTLLDRALAGLDANLTSMTVASKNMAFLRRMSEGQGWLGRLKLYAMIMGLWVVVILLVFVGPKFRF